MCRQNNSKVRCPWHAETEEEVLVAGTTAVAARVAVDEDPDLRQSLWWSSRSRLIRLTTIMSLRRSPSTIGVATIICVIHIHSLARWGAGNEILGLTRPRYRPRRRPTAAITKNTLEHYD
jgi:hypothetical protein